MHGNQDHTRRHARERETIEYIGSEIKEGEPGAPLTRSACSTLVRRGKSRTPPSRMAMLEVRRVMLDCSDETHPARGTAAMTGLFQHAAARAPKRGIVVWRWGVGGFSIQHEKRRRSCYHIIGVNRTVVADSTTARNTSPRSGGCTVRGQLKCDISQSRWLCCFFPEYCGAAALWRKSPLKQHDNVKAA